MKLFSTILTLAGVTWAAQSTMKKAQKAEPAGMVQSLTEEYCNAFVSSNTGDLERFYTEASTISFESELPFGGFYQGKNITTFFARIPLTLDVLSEVNKDILQVDEAKGTALVLTSAEVVFKRTQEQALAKMVHILTWDQGSSTLLSHTIIDQNTDETSEAYRTLAEKKLWRLLWTFFESGEELWDSASPFWQGVSDDIKVRYNIFPKGAFGPDEFEGKEKVAQGTKGMWDALMSSPRFKKNLYHDMSNLEILAATDTEVFVSCRNGNAIVHYTFEEGEGGQLIAEEVLLSAALNPWDVHPFPLPVTLDEEEDEEDLVYGAKDTGSFTKGTQDDYRRSGKPTMRYGAVEEEEEEEEQGNYRSFGKRPVKPAAYEEGDEGDEGQGDINRFPSRFEARKQPGRG